MKIILDRNVWIRFLRNPNARAEFEARMNRSLLFMSSVVAMELLAGGRTGDRARALAILLKPFERAGRIVIPDHGCFRETGRVLASLSNDGIGQAHRLPLVNDVLIAVSTARAGAILITHNAEDFFRIARHTPVRWMVPEQRHSL
jgi:predicted nucleic acid-binding protein